ncbi:hypothetical protein FHX52_2511 [Humibacillus xanthopallidus]|uniref:Hemerythrin-like domain-containing protein n=1 Tax=Humibacillus xanthopallidus TaxID=412689 RepID=A0A543PP17_9MICO|nr:hemerythrin domain-containing protein [Humibacillus xanthopallidus]TQN45811.1 hypothetical protein FHX52_2511 [Humibacillus xanthopallidus]
MMQTQPDTARPATTGSELTAYLDQVRTRRAELHDSLSAVDLALESAIGRGGVWRERLHAALAELAHDFSDHVEVTERPGGIYDRISASAPRLVPAIERQRAEHRDFAEAIDGFLAVLEHGGTVADLPAFREEVTTLVGRLRRHRQVGGDLVYEAYEVDLGGSG